MAVPIPGAVDRDLYAILGVPKDASSEELKTAYRRIVLYHHPDRHLDPQRKATATQEFHQIQYAYTALTDPNWRELYDRCGHEGLRAAMELGQHLSVREFLKAKFEREQRAVEHKLEARLNQHATLTMQFDGRKTLPQGLAPALVRSMGDMDVQMPISSRDLIIVGGSIDNVESGDGRGSSSLHSTFRRQFGGGAYTEISTVLSKSGSTFNMKVRRRVKNVCIGEMIVSFGNGIAMTVVANKQLSENSTGSINVNNAGIVTISFSRRSPRTQSNMLLKLGAKFFGFGLKYSRMVSRLSSLIMGFKCTLKGVEFETGGSRQLSARTSVAYSLVCGAAGVSAKIRVSRGGTRFVFPIALSSQVAPLFVAGGLLVPGVVAALVKHFILVPLKQSKLEKERRREEAATAHTETAGRPD
eukprot:tig00020909_g15360.t1